MIRDFEKRRLVEFFKKLQRKHFSSEKLAIKKILKINLIN